MKIIWNSIEKRFEAEFAQGIFWASDKDSAQSAGLKCIGPPAWVWWCAKTTPLTELKENRPSSGLTITKQALEMYLSIKAVEDKNAEVKAQLLSAKKALKKQKTIETASESEIYDESFSYGRVKPEDRDIWINPYIPPATPTTLCSVCSTPVYFYELQDPPTCLDCEFPQLDEIKLDTEIGL
jgi:hypothetical protein